MTVPLLDQKGSAPLAVTLNPLAKPAAGPAAGGQSRKPRSGGAAAPALTGWRRSGLLGASGRRLNTCADGKHNGNAERPRFNSVQ